MLLEFFMLNFFKKADISKLRIEHCYDYRSIEKTIDFNPGQAGTSMSIRDINKIRTLSVLDPIQSIFEENFDMCKLLNIQEIDNVKWDLLIGKSKCQNYTERLLKEINFTRRFLTTYHTETYCKRISLYQNLNQIKDKSGNILEVPVYSHSSVSGRTSIKKGFNFLTSSKEFRSSCNSLTPENVLVSIDFKSCEPNLYLRAIGKEIKDPDVYSHLVKKLKIKTQSREKLKRGILAVLYGASDDTATRILSGNKQTLDKIKSFFDVEKTTAILRQKFKEQGFIFNMYGRPVFSEKSILNKWIQSSAVDFCSLAFLAMTREYELDVAYLVHDEMVVDCSVEKYRLIKDISAVTDPITNISLPVEVTLLSR